MLREAAALMRERAEAATPGPWERSWDNQMIAGYGSPCDGEQLADFFDSESNAVHAASWHPAVALAVADWLEQTAISWHLYENHAIRNTAIVTARAYLGNPT